MLYRLFLYGSTALTGHAAAVNIANIAVSTDSEKQWKNVGAICCLKHFDIERVVRCIEKELTDPVTGLCKCRPVVKYPPKQYDQIGFIYVATSYAKAAEVLPKLHAIASENDLALYDAETGRSFFRDLVDHTYITMRNRQRALNEVILKEMKPVWKIRQLQFVSEERDKWCSYVVTIRKSSDVSFADRSKCFAACLQNNLCDNESLVCKDRCYRIVGERYSITYVLEGYKKHPNQIGYIDRGTPCVSAINRMGVEEAWRWMEENCTKIEKGDIWARMQFREMQDKYPNPAQRFVESVNITKWQRKQVFDIRYSGHGYYGSEILFHVVSDSYYGNANEISVLKIEENSASFILPFIVDVYPDLNERYYLENNHISSKMWERIIDRLKRAREIVLYNTFDPVLRPYVEDFNLFVLADHSKPNWTEEVKKKDAAQFLYEHRYQVGYLYDVFIRWAEAQLSAHAYCSALMFNIKGP